MLLSLGMFIFEMATLPFQELSRRTEWRHGQSPRFGARAANQYLGPGEDSITLSGCLVPEIAGSQDAVVTLRTMADQGESYPLVDGTGRIHGNFIIRTIDTRGGYLLDNGVPRKTDFNIDLQRVS
jgi:phage protein U